MATRMARRSSSCFEFANVDSILRLEFLTASSKAEALSGKGFSGLPFWVCRTILELCQLA
jgi:hypothetical protein